MQSNGKKRIWFHSQFDIFLGELILENVDSKYDRCCKYSYKGKVNRKLKRNFEDDCLIGLFNLCTYIRKINIKIDLK